MLDTANYTPRLKALFATTIRASLKEEFGYKNGMMAPKLDKIVLNMGIGEAVKDTKKVKSAEADMTLIAGQKAVITKADGVPSTLSLRFISSCRFSVRPKLVRGASSETCGAMRSAKARNCC